MPRKNHRAGRKFQLKKILNKYTECIPENRTLSSITLNEAYIVAAVPAVPAAQAVQLPEANRPLVYCSTWRPEQISLPLTITAVANIPTEDPRYAVYSTPRNHQTVSQLISRNSQSDDGRMNRVDENRKLNF